MIRSFPTLLFWNLVIFTIQLSSPQQCSVEATTTHLRAPETVIASWSSGTLPFAAQVEQPRKRVEGTSVYPLQLIRKLDHQTTLSQESSYVRRAQEEVSNDEDTLFQLPSEYRTIIFVVIAILALMCFGGLMFCFCCAEMLCSCCGLCDC